MTGFYNFIQKKIAVSTQCEPPPLIYRGQGGEIFEKTYQEGSRFSCKNKGGELIHIRELSIEGGAFCSNNAP